MTQISNSLSIPLSSPLSVVLTHSPLFPSPSLYVLPTLGLYPIRHFFYFFNLSLTLSLTLTLSLFLFLSTLPGQSEKNTFLSLPLFFSLPLSQSLSLSLFIYFLSLFAPLSLSQIHPLSCLRSHESNTTTQHKAH